MKRTLVQIRESVIQDRRPLYYVVVRADMTPGQKLSQATHAVHLACFNNQMIFPNASAVVLEIKNELHMLKFWETMKQTEVPGSCYYDSYLQETTALCFPRVLESHRHHFSHLSLAK